MSSKVGECCICGSIGGLTFEHVPPRAAFNDRRVFEASIENLFAGQWIPGTPITKGRYVQRGAGRHSLCQKCNNDTGAWYGTPYVDFTRQAMTLLDRSKGELSLAYPYRIFPLRVLKQIVVMFLSACGPGLRKAHPDLVRFALNRETQFFPTYIDIWAYLHHPTESTSVRQAGVAGLINPDGPHVFSEIAFPPFGLIMSLNGPPLNKELYNLTHFRERPFNAWRAARDARCRMFRRSSAAVATSKPLMGGNHCGVSIIFPPISMTFNFTYQSNLSPYLWAIIICMSTTTAKQTINGRR